MRTRKSGVPGCRGGHCQEDRRMYRGTFRAGSAMCSGVVLQAIRYSEGLREHGHFPNAGFFGAAGPTFIERIKALPLNDLISNRVENYLPEFRCMQLLDDSSGGSYK